MMRYYIRLLTTSVVGFLAFSASSAVAQTTNNITVPNNAASTANPEVILDQQGSLVNTQVNHTTLGRSIVGKGIADCTSNGISLSAYGSGVGPFDTGTIGGAVTYTHSFGMDTCKQYAKNQLGKAKLETCLLLISNYSKMVKAGIDVSYTALMEVANIDCPPVTVRQAVIPQSSPTASADFAPATVPSAPTTTTEANTSQTPGQQKRSILEPMRTPVQAASQSHEPQLPDSSVSPTTQQSEPRRLSAKELL